jgi:hypothetical protein
MVDALSKVTPTHRTSLLCKIDAGLLFLQANPWTRACHYIKNGNVIYFYLCVTGDHPTMLICLTCRAPSNDSL